MSRIFRSGTDYASVETGHYLAYVCINGVGHITHARNTRSVLDCQKTLQKETGKEWRWIA